MCREKIITIIHDGKKTKSFKCPIEIIYSKGINSYRSNIIIFFKNNDHSSDPQNVVTHSPHTLSSDITTESRGSGHPLAGCNSRVAVPLIHIKKVDAIIIVIIIIIISCRRWLLSRVQNPSGVSS